jgi:hypothetical protein
LIEDLLEAGQPRVQAERGPRRVGADLQDLPRRHGDRRPPAVIERIVVRHQHAERVVAAAQIQHDEVPRPRALRAREIRQELRSGERHRERRDAALDELPSGDLHVN